MDNRSLEMYIQLYYNESKIAWSEEKNLELIRLRDASFPELLRAPTLELRDNAARPHQRLARLVSRVRLGSPFRSWGKRDLLQDGISEQALYEGVETQEDVMKPVKLSKYERQLEREIERGEWKPVSREEFDSFVALLKRARKDVAISLRLNSNDLARIKDKAKAQGVPYQRLISELIHHYAMQ
ncbi:MAG: hypothetical protein HYV14_07530 [Elusimicrobia bacterium]|nr:hypothetical protein [Elusimicrobiota bacterium]